MSRFIAALFLLAAFGCEQPECSDGTVRCGDRCIRIGTQTDCGGCGIACGAGLVCRAGECACPYGQLPCGGACVDPASDGAHCGACDVRCGAAECVGGHCMCASGELCDGACVDTRIDARHCGACGVECTAERGCTGGECVCPAGALDCGWGCVDALVDAANCGRCGVTCEADRTCAEGECVCRSGTPCPDGCRDLMRDETSCGACGVACVALAGDACRDGRCVPRLEWVRTQDAGYRYFDMGRDTSLAAADDGGVFASWGVDSNYNTAIHVARFSAGGDELWRTFLFAGYRSAPSGLTARPGQVVVAVDDGTLAAFDDATGDMAFRIALGTSVDDVAAAPDGSVLATGTYRTSITLGARTFGSRGHRDLFLARLDAAGGVTQAHAFGGIADDMDARVAVDGATGTVYLAGHTGAGLSLGGPVLGSSVAGFLGGLTAEGAHLFSMRLEIDDVHEIDVVPGGVALLGVTNRSTTIGGVMLDGGRLFAGVWEADGAARWVVGLHAAPDYRHQGAIAFGDGAVYVTSGFTGEVVIGGTRLADTDRRDVFLGALAASGGAGLWVAGFGGLDDDDTHAIVATPGAVTISGRFDQSVDFGGETRISASSTEDSFVARYAL